jgi:hypothetical protein
MQERADGAEGHGDAALVGEHAGTITRASAVG